MLKTDQTIPAAKKLWTSAYLAALVVGVFTSQPLRALPPESTLPTSATQTSTQDLPSESLLPGIVTKTVTRAFPSEHELPQRSSGLDGAATATPSSQVQTPEKIPPGRPAANNQNQLNALQAALAGSRDDRVRLRLAVPEHTSNVMALGFDASSTHLFTGGDDKVVHHWQLVDLPGRSTKEWIHQETIRWQVGSGQVGFVRALACAGNILFIAGYGSEGTRGEILRYDWINKRWPEPWVDHARPVVALTALRDQSLVSVDENLGVGYRNPNGNFQWLKQSDAQRVGYWPVVAWSDATGSTWAMGAKGAATPWQVQSQSLAQPAATRVFSPVVPPGQELSVMRPLVEYRQRAFPKNDAARDAQAMAKMVAPNLYLLAASSDGRMIAAVDDADPVAFGMWLYVWRSGQLILKHRIIGPDDVYRYLAWSPTGNELAVLSNVSENNRRASLVEVWRFQGAIPQVTTLARYADECFTLRFSPDNKWLAIGGRSGAKMVELGIAPRGLRLPDQNMIVPVSDIAFATSGYAWQATLPNGTITFDPLRMASSAAPQTQWLGKPVASNGWRAGGLSIQIEKDGYHVKRGPDEIGLIDPCDSRVITPINVAQWINDDRGVPEALAVAYRVQRENEIHVFSLKQTGNGRLQRLRIFTGHEGQVRSLAVSADQKFLLSSATDKLVCTWPLAGLRGGDDRLSPAKEKWGAQFAQDNAKLILENLSPASPLFEFGLRSGDEILELNWFSLAADTSTVVAHAVPANADAIAFLNSDDYDTIVKFSYQRPGTGPRHVQLKPHWRPLISQTFSGGREWAAWTAPGYYTSSFNGNVLFGWQVNRGIKSPPDFYRADRFQALLERPEVLKRILIAGSVDAAAQAVGERLGSSFHPLNNAIALQPEVKIITPRASHVVTGAEQIVEAQIVLPRGSEIASLKAFANGVPAVLKSNLQQTPTEATSDKVTYLATWRAGLPSDQNVKLQVAVANSERLVGTDEVIIRRTQIPAQSRRRRLWLFAGGVGNYADDRIAPLQTPERNVESFADWIERAADGIYDCQVPLVLSGAHMTRSRWLAIVHEKLSQLRSTVRPDDLVVIFLSGHGLQEAETQDYYFVTANAQYGDVRSGAMSQCLGIREIAPFAELACRKIVILDTCHSGALQPLEADRLKSAVRALQADLVLTLTASEGDQAAAEVVGHPHSLFTEVLGTALAAPKDDNGDRLYSWPELVKQVREGVLEQSTALNMAQSPTVVPAELLPYIQLPLAKVSTANP